MGKNPNGKPRQKKNSRTRRKRWNLRKNRCKRTLHPTARFLENRFPSISNDLPTAASIWWNVLAVEECVLSPRRPPVQSTHPSAGQQTPLTEKRWSATGKT